MADKPEQFIPFADAKAMLWKEHPRVKNVFMKTLLTVAENPLANLNMVQVPVDGVVPKHIHAEQVETIYVLSGTSTLLLGQENRPFSAGQAAAIPAGLEHGLTNIGSEPVELLTFFTPPLL